MELQEQKNRISKLMGVLKEKNERFDLSACKSIYSNQLLEQAKDWWLQTLVSPATISKLIYKKYGYKNIEQIPKEKADIYLNEIKSKILAAMDFIQKVKLNFTWDNIANYNAWVSILKKDTIVINCNSAMNKDAALSLLVHEFQHTIDEFLGTDDTWSPVSRFDPKKPMKRLDIEYLKNEMDKYINIFGSDKNENYLDDYFFSKEQLRKNPHFISQKYNCSASEIASRASEVRLKFKMPISQPISLEFLRRNPKAYNLMLLTLLCWAARTDNLSLEDFLTNVDVLVKKQSDKKINSV